METLNLLRTAGPKRVALVWREHLGTNRDYGFVHWANQSLTALVHVDRELDRVGGLIVVRTDDITGLQWNTDRTREYETRLKPAPAESGDPYRRLESDDIAGVVAAASRRFGVCCVYREAIDTNKFEACVNAVAENKPRDKMLRMATIGLAGEPSGDQCVNPSEITRLEIDTVHCGELLAMSAKSSGKSNGNMVNSHNKQSAAPARRSRSI